MLAKYSRTKFGGLYHIAKSEAQSMFSPDFSVHGVLWRSKQIKIGDRRGSQVEIFFDSFYTLPDELVLEKPKSCRGAPKLECCFKNRVTFFSS
jgi:hypothetical protein